VLFHAKFQPNKEGKTGTLLNEKLYRLNLVHSITPFARNDRPFCHEGKTNMRLTGKTVEQKNPLSDTNPFLRNSFRDNRLFRKMHTKKAYCIADQEYFDSSGILPNQILFQKLKYIMRLVQAHQSSLSCDLRIG